MKPSPFALVALTLLSQRNTAHGAGSTALRGRALLQGCQLDDAIELKSELDETSDVAESCNERAEQVRGYVGGALTAIVRVRTIRDKGAQIHDALESFESTLSKIAAVSSLIPKVGPIIRKIDKTLDKFNDIVESLLDRTNNFESVEPKLQNASDWLGVVAGVTDKTSRLAEDAATVLGQAMVCSAGNGCIFGDRINTLARLVPLEPLDAAQILFRACSLDLDIDFDLDLSFLPDFTFLDEIVAVINNIVTWVKGAVDGVAGQTSYALCCENVLRPIGDIAEFLTGLADLSTCWVDGAISGVADESLDVLFEDFDTMVDVINDRVVGQVNSLIGDFNSIEIEVPRIGLPSFEYDQKTCEIGVESGYVGEASVVFSPDSELLDYIKGDFDGDFNAKAIGQAIAAECSEAWDAITSNDEVDCCDIARTCDTKDTIILYEGDGCTQNIAGTLRLPTKGGSSTVRAFDHLCLANDESRSVKLFGPMPAGTRIEVGDDPDSFCDDDYSAIVLSRPLEEGENMCVDKFEPANGKLKTDFSKGYTLYHQRKNGLQGKVSRYSVTVPKSGQELGPQCLEPGLTFYEGNECGQDVAGRVPLPDRTKRVSGSSGLTNDEARSLKLVGPIPAGTQIEVGDHPSDFCADDYASIIVTKEIDTFEEVCIPSFERAGQFAEYKMAFRNNNGLDGKVSRYEVYNSGQKTGDGLDLNRCVPEARIIFHEGNSCSQDVVATLIAPGRGKTTTVKATSSSAMNNDEARSVKLVGPLPDGLRVIVSDQPDGKPTDDQTVIVLRRSLFDGEEACVASFHTALSTSTLDVVRSRNKNGLDGKVSNVQIYHPSDSRSTKDVMRSLQWSPFFSEENGGKSNTSPPAPIQGVYCSGNDCDEKSLMRAVRSRCTGSSRYNTDYFSEERGTSVKCRDGYYVAGMQCKGSNCDDISLVCVKAHSRCNIYGSSQFGTFVSNGRQYVAEEGDVLTGAKCFDSNCGRLELIFRKMKLN